MKIALVLLMAAVTLVSANQVAVDAPPPTGGDKRPPPAHPRNKRAACGPVTKLTSDQFVEAINAHNSVRGREPAANMRKTYWNDEMSSVAQAWANECQWKHGMLNDCSGNRIGQNLYVEASPDKVAPKLNLTYVVESWNNERNDWTWETSTCAPGKLCGHWTQLAAAYSSGVGCAYNYCPTITVGGAVWYNALYVACDYTPPGNVMGEPIYLKGAPCSNCDSDGTGMGYKCENNLCASCTPATDASCKCGKPLQCANGGSWSDSTCSCTCAKGFYGLKCESSCTCGDASPDCDAYKPYCTDADYKDFMVANCKKTCNFACNVPASCSA